MTDLLLSILVCILIGVNSLYWGCQKNSRTLKLLGLAAFALAIILAILFIIALS